MPERETPWINPVGGLGDALMLSGVLKLVHERHPERSFHLIRRTKYPSILAGHPALRRTGFPPEGAPILHTDYWEEPMGPGPGRAFQILARRFGLEGPVPERLYLPGAPEADPLLHGHIPWGDPTVLIAPASDSPRKVMHAHHWRRLVAELRARGAEVLQAGRRREPHIAGAHSLLGLTTPRQLVSVLARCQLVVTSDNFVMHAAHLAGVPAVVLWGPTEAAVYGYGGQVHLAAPRACPDVADCLGPRTGHYGHPCPHGPEGHCMNHIGDEAILRAVLERLDLR
jgi:ADP-heptose:LPS heptosyltransferase